MSQDALVIALDRVQKRKDIDRDVVAGLKRRGLVEGRFPNVYVAAKVAAATDAKADHIRNRAFDKNYYKQLIVSYLGVLRGVQEAPRLEALRHPRPGPKGEVHRESPAGDEARGRHRAAWSSKEREVGHL